MGGGGSARGESGRDIHRGQGPGRLWLRERPLLLASTSPTRGALLESVGLPIEAIRPQVDERAIEAEAGGLSAIKLAETLAIAKAESVARVAPDRVVVGADQVLEIDGEVLHKPADRSAACVHLARLSGRTHALHSAVALAERGSVVACLTASARLTMRTLTAEAIERYVDLAGAAVVTGSVGAYQIEALGIHLFSRIEGDHATILGLPLIPLLGLMRERGHLAF